MLQLLNICKSYTTADFTQTALDNVSVSFRDNEFVAILGPSGSGKTTLLNIVGGLDHYDSGNLIIDGISTEQYKDKDWDAYRNNRIGFVFQSYNLIPHQTVLSNVELALTLSGVSRAERHDRAVAALEQVGLGDHINKKPSQLSGGQMQRVAIARALINDPEILLADEPTGALDSKTSVQIMDLLTEIANDRLVIMVTHNPELAEDYATRIVTLTDGVIRSDTDPFDPTAEDMRESEKPARRTKMSFLTALALSFKNLMTKKGRTLMTAFAGSIGIIGIAAILALANGVNNYIKSVEEETLSEYPLQIQSTGFDMTSMMFGAAGEGAEASGDGGTEEKPEDSVHVVEMVSNMVSSIGSNDLASLKEYLDSGESDIDQYTSAIEYTYSVAPQIFSADAEKLRQVNPDKSFSALGLGSSTSSNSLMSMSMSTDTFYEMPSDPNLYEYQYDVKAGRWPENHNEVVLVLTGNGGISDFMLYTLGLRDSAELDDMVKKFAAEEEVTAPTDMEDPSYEDILGVSFKLVNAADYYVHDDEFNVWKDKTDDEAYMRELVENGEDIEVVGVVQPRDDATATMLSSGINYPATLTDYVIEEAADSAIVKDQIAHPDTNVFTGKSFDDEDGDEDGFSMESLFTIDGDAIQAAFKFDESALTSGLSGMSLDLSGLSLDMGSLPAFDGSAIAIDPTSIDMGQYLDFSDIKLDLGDVQPDMDSAKMQAAMKEIMEGFNPWYKNWAQEQVAQGKVPTMEDGAKAYLESEEVQQKIADAIMGSINMDQATEALQAQLQQQIGAKMQQAVPAMAQALQGQLQASISTAMSSYMQNVLGAYMQQMQAAIETQVSAAMQQSMSQIAANMSNAMSIDESAFQNAFQMNMSEEELGELMMSLMNTEDTSYDNNLKKLGYADPAKPGGIDIYPIDFESKEKVIEILDGYNDRMTADGQEDKVITYTDFVGTLMSSVTDIVNMISYVLVAFVAISLVVSSIMIGVITYISVLERKKEIGILRSIGASKGDISRVFNAETIIVGFTAGVIGIGLTALACIPANAIVYSLFDVANVASLPWQAAVILVAISVFLTFLAGLIPSSAASRKDPVEALRSE
ncbi:ABC transporter ATP-binding protein/permease [Eggerthella guodeyinii]|uniref:ATP-binding cassette domain-containing protein n=1 Tax=Eggerthella guodeyinii TaxID=2690837 RepID=A0A6N7RNU4_9ACTN|nr:ABC transporter ATP-binding protein/permease [Eggerthella guodeyinii]MRX82647.1 ATP-binding cassette domain-containing protein [Eggerthella guodeyinii]